jgi:hypothetical protein
LDDEETGILAGWGKKDVEGLTFGERGVGLGGGVRRGS